MDDPHDISLLYILGVGGITAFVIWVGYGVMWLAMRMIEWIERG